MVADEHLKYGWGEKESEILILMNLNFKGLYVASLYYIRQQDGKRELSSSACICIRSIWAASRD